MDYDFIPLFNCCDKYKNVFKRIHHNCHNSPDIENETHQKLLRFSKQVHVSLVYYCKSQGMYIYILIPSWSIKTPFGFYLMTLPPLTQLSELCLHKDVGWYPQCITINDLSVCHCHHQIIIYIIIIVSNSNRLPFRCSNTLCLNPQY